MHWADTRFTERISCYYLLYNKGKQEEHMNVYTRAYHEEEHQHTAEIGI